MSAVPGIILTDYRTGGSFLSLCLDSHPLIFCNRGEPLARRSGFYRFFPNLAPEQVLQHIFKTEFCKVALGKVIYRQAGTKVWKYLANMDTKIIHLIRRNTLRASCSYLFQVSVLQGKTKHPHALHHFNRPATKPRPMKLDPHAVLAKCRERERSRKKAWKIIEKHKCTVQVVYYEQMCSDEEISELPDWLSETLCDFLDVPHYKLIAPYMRRVNAQYPLSDLVINWRQVKQLIKETEFAHWLEESSD